MTIEVSLILTSSVLIGFVGAMVAIAVKFTNVKSDTDSNTQSLLCINDRLNILEEKDTKNQVALAEIKTDLSYIKAMSTSIFNKLGGNKE